MEKHEVNIDGIDFFLRTLGVRWPVTFYLVPGVDTCKISTSLREKAHEVWLREEVVAHPNEYVSDIAHELGHAVLAEQVDIVFSCYTFSRRYGELQGEAKEQFEKNAHLLALAGAHADLWVNDLRHEHWPEMTKVDNNLFVRDVVGLVELGRPDLLSQKASFVAICHYQAEIERHPVGSPDLFQFLPTRGVRIHPQAVELVEYYKSLPRLTFKPRKDLKLLERSTQEVAKILNLPFTPRLVWAEDRWVWEMD